MVFGTQVVAIARLYRLPHHSHMLPIQGDIYRLREKPRSGLLKPSAATTSMLSSGEEKRPG